MKKLFACAVALLAITGCESPNEPNHGHWTIAETSRGFIAIQDDWRIEVQNGDLDNGVVAGVHVSYKLAGCGKIHRERHGPGGGARWWGAVLQCRLRGAVG